MAPPTHTRTPSTRSSLSGQEGVLYIEPTPRFYRLYDRADAANQHNTPPLMQSHAAFLVWEGTSYGLSLAFHKKDVTFDEGKGAGLVPSNRKGTSKLASQYYDLITREDARIEGVAWTFAADTLVKGPLEGTLNSADVVCLETSKFPASLEEDESILGHVKNPYHRVDAVRTSRHIQIYAKTDSGNEVLVADTNRGDATKSQPMAIFETALPTRWYLPADCLIVNERGTSKMTPSPACGVEDYPKDGFTTVCPYKGIARYHKLVLPDNGGTIDNAVWAYPEALPALDLRGLTCFWTPGNNRLKLVVDGEHIAE